MKDMQALQFADFFGTVDLVQADGTGVVSLVQSSWSADSDMVEVHTRQIGHRRLRTDPFGLLCWSTIARGYGLARRRLDLLGARLDSFLSVGKPGDRAG